jgi:hypothetical protein
MTSEDIHDEQSFRAWLREKPSEWARLLSLRSMLRVLPIMVINEDNARLQKVMLRAAFIAWATQKYASRTEFSDTKTKRRSVADEASRVARSAAFAARDYALANPEDLASPDVSSLLANIAQLTVDDGEPANIAIGVTFAARAAVHADPSGAEVIWREIRGDAGMLERGSPSERMLLDLLWRNGEPQSFESLRRTLFDGMVRDDPNAWVWRDWYSRRFTGVPVSWNWELTESADNALVLRIADQPETFWDRALIEVNADIAGWIQDVEVTNSADEPMPEPDPQNPIAPVFVSDAEGHIDIDVASGSDAVQHDEEAVDRHGETRAAVDRAIAACSGNAAAGTRQSLERYAGALGEAIEALRPGQLIQRGEGLRQELSVRERDAAENRDTDMPPIPGQALLALSAVVTAHNLLVGLDPALSRRDEARLGPDAPQTQISPQDAHEIAESAANADILTDDARDAIDTAADLAPAQPNPENRRSRLLAETVRNFGRAVVAVLNAARRAPVATAAVTVVAATSTTTGVAGGIAFGTGAGVAAGVLAAGSGLVGCYKLGQWAQKNEDWFRRIFAGSPTMLRAIDYLMDQLDKLPLK